MGGSVLRRLALAILSRTSCAAHSAFSSFSPIPTAGGACRTPTAVKSHALKAVVRPSVVRWRWPGRRTPCMGPEKYGFMTGWSDWSDAGAWRPAACRSSSLKIQRRLPERREMAGQKGARLRHGLRSWAASAHPQEGTPVIAETSFEEEKACWLRGRDERPVRCVLESTDGRERLTSSRLPGDVEGRSARWKLTLTAEWKSARTNRRARWRNSSCRKIWAPATTCMRQSPVQRRTVAPGGSCVLPADAAPKGEQSGGSSKVI